MPTPLHIQSIGGTDLEFDSLGGDLLAIDINGTDISKQFVVEKPDQARLLLYLAENLGINLAHLADYATDVGSTIQAIAIDRALKAAKASESP